MNDYSKLLRDNYYVPVTSFLDEDLASVIELTLLLRVVRGQYITDNQSHGQPAWGGDALLDSILLTQREKVEKLSGYDLYPTYAYARTYLPGAILEPHKDRPACEVSVSCLLGFDGDPCPIYFVKDNQEDVPLRSPYKNPQQRYAGKPTELVLKQPGDAVIYLGTKIIHWREKQSPKTGRLVQIFLHYVRRDGPFSSYKYDGRAPADLLQV